MTAARLREAAARLREVEADATHPDNMYPWGDKSLPRMTVDDWAPSMDGYLGGAWGVFAGVMSPTVALALAASLEATAEIADKNDPRWKFDASLAVADAILGEVS